MLCLYRLNAFILINFMDRLNVGCFRLGKYLMNPGKSVTAIILEVLDNVDIFLKVSLQ
jgi:hypothetical protein